MNNETFKKWFLSFLEKNDGVQKTFCPPDIDKWIDKTHSTKDEIRKILGGEKCQVFVKLKSQQNSVPLDEIAAHANAIKALLPSYLSDNGFSEDVFLNPFIQLSSHSETAKKTGMKLTKHISQYAKGTDPARQKNINKHLESLGAVWAKYRTNDIELECTISTTPMGFALLGHYNPDKDSCFRQGSDKTADKYCIAQTKNSFVLTIAAKKKSGDGWINKARAFGFYEPQGGKHIFHIANVYMSPGFTEGDVIECIKTTLGAITSKNFVCSENKMKIYDSDSEHRTSGVYYNQYGRFSFHEPDSNQDFAASTIVVDTNEIKCFHCPRCRDKLSLKHKRTVEGQDLCVNCIEVLPRCDITGDRTLKDMFVFIDDAGRQFNIKAEIAKIIATGFKNE